MADVRNILKIICGKFLFIVQVPVYHELLYDFWHLEVAKCKFNTLSIKYLTVIHPRPKFSVSKVYDEPWRL
jgi:hypothetical protein